MIDIGEDQDLVFFFLLSFFLHILFLKVVEKYIQENFL